MAQTATNLSAFNQALTKSVKKINGDMADWYTTVILETFRRIDRRTPVDTGLAQWNWQITIGMAAAGVLSGESSGGQLGSVFEREAGKLVGIPPFSIVFITNNVEYISYLEYHKRSPQHPEGMVEITLSEMAKWLGTAGNK